MNKRLLILLLFIFPITFLQGQEKITEEQRTMYSKILFANKKLVFDDQTFQYQEQKFDESVFFNTILSKEEIRECLRVIEETGHLEIDKVFDEKKLFFRAKLSDKFNRQLQDELIVELKESNLEYSDGKKLELDGVSSTLPSYGKIELKIRIAEELDTLQKITGNTTYYIKFLAQYEKVKLSKFNINEVFKLGGCDFKLVNVIKNKVIVENLCGEKLDLNIINFTKNGNAVKPYSYFELLDLKKNNKNINVNGAFTKSVNRLYKKIYKIFESNPQITAEEFDKKITIDLLEMLKNSPKYEIIKNVANFEENFILYVPKYQIEEITVGRK